MRPGRGHRAPVAATVFSRVLIVLLLVGLGWLARRAKVVDEAGLGALSRLNIDLAFPALVLARLLATVDGPALQAEWYVPVSALVLLPFGWWLGKRLTGRATDAFLVGLPNWIFLPLLIAQALFGAAGERTVLLFNAGAQVALWTVGVATLTGRADPRALLRNPGLWATALGIGVALAVPALGELARHPGRATGAASGVAILLEGLDLFGTMAVPLSLTITGAQLGGLRVTQALRLDGRLVRVLGLRLLAMPLLAWAAVLGLEALGMVLDPRARLVILFTAGMPVAISGAVHARRFGGEADLAARAVLWSTALALATAPALVAWVH